MPALTHADTRPDTPAGATSCTWRLRWLCPGALCAFAAVGLIARTGTQQHPSSARIILAYQSRDSRIRILHLGTRSRNITKRSESPQFCNDRTTVSVTTVPLYETPMQKLAARFITYHAFLFSNNSNMHAFMNACMLHMHLPR